MRPFLLFTFEVSVPFLLAVNAFHFCTRCVLFCAAVLLFLAKPVVLLRQCMLVRSWRSKNATLGHCSPSNLPVHIRPCTLPLLLMLCFCFRFFVQQVAVPDGSSIAGSSDRASQSPVVPLHGSAAQQVSEARGTFSSYFKYMYCILQVLEVFNHTTQIAGSLWDFFTWKCFKLYSV